MVRVVFFFFFDRGRSGVAAISKGAPFFLTPSKLETPIGSKLAHDVSLHSACPCLFLDVSVKPRSVSLRVRFRRGITATVIDNAPVSIKRWFMNTWCVLEHKSLCWCNRCWTRGIIRP